jgi:hypothetical protein
LKTLKALPLGYNSWLNALKHNYQPGRFVKKYNSF